MTIEELQTQVEALTAALQSQGTQIDRRQAHIGAHKDLLHPPPSASVAKQNFFYDGMSLPHVRTEFPVLRFRLTETGVEERCCKNAKEVEALGSEWTATPPTIDLPSPLESLEALMATLSPEDRELVMVEQRNVRLRAIQTQLAALSPEDLEAVGSGIPMKRKPGRPKKVD